MPQIISALLDTDTAPTVPLDRLKPGETAEIVRLDGLRRGYLQRLTSFGLAPGRIVRLRQRHPALVLQLGETELALDRAAAREILVRRMAEDEGGQAAAASIS